MTASPGGALLVALNGSQARQLVLVADQLPGVGLAPVLCAADHLRAGRDTAEAQLALDGRDHVTLPFRRWGPGQLLPGRRKFRPLPRGADLDRWLASLDPSVVVVGNDARPLPRALLRSCRRLGVATVLVQDGVRPEPREDRRLRVRLSRRLPTLAAERYGLGGCDRVVVMSDRFAEQLEAAGVGAQAIVRAGFVLYDRLVTAPSPPATELHPGSFVLYASQPFGLSDDDAVAHYRAVAAACREAEVGLVIKGHPRDRQLAGLVPVLAASDPDVVVVQDVAPDAAIRAASAVLVAFSTMALEALLLGVPVVLHDLVRTPNRLDLQGAAPVVREPAALAPALRQVVHDPEVRARLLARAAEVVAAETHSTDGRAAERAAAAVAAAAQRRR